MRLSICTLVQATHTAVCERRYKWNVSALQVSKAGYPGLACAYCAGVGGYGPLLLHACMQPTGRLVSAHSLFH